VIGSLPLNIAAFLGALVVLTAGVRVLMVQQDALATESLREVAGSIAAAVDTLARRGSEGRVLLVGEGGAAPSHFRGSEYALLFNATAVTLAWRSLSARAAFGGGLHPWPPATGLTATAVATRDATPLDIGSGLRVWAVRAPLETDGRTSWATFLEVA